MKSTQQVYEKVNPFEYEELKNFLASEEHLQVVSTGIDSFVVTITELVGNYNRNGNILVMTLNQTDLSDDTVEDLQGKFTSIVGKPESVDKVQAFPLQTPLDPKTGLPVVPPVNPYESDPGATPGGSEEEEQEEEENKEDLPGPPEPPKTGETVSGEAGKPESGESQTPAKNKAADVPEVKPTKKNPQNSEQKYDPNQSDTEQNTEVQ